MSASPVSPRPAPWYARHGEAILVAALVVFYFSCFNLDSWVNGGRNDDYEIFEQDSPWVIRSLVDQKHYLYNPQHHLLYHWLIEKTYGALVRAGCPHTRQGVYLFLKIFTAATGALFFALLSRLLAEIGLSRARRMVLIFFSGVSVVAWFHFSSFETHGLTLIPMVLYWTSVLRLIRKPEAGFREYLCLGTSIALAALCRIELWRLLPLTVPLCLAPALERHRAGISVSLLAALLLGAGAYLLLAVSYYHLPPGQIAAVVTVRKEDPRLQKKLMRLDNLYGKQSLDMVRATTFYTLMIPAGKKLFETPLSELPRRVLPLMTFAAVAVLWADLLGRLWRRRKRPDLFHLMLMLHWLAALLFYTWFNPHQPFLWLLGFLLLLILAMADTHVESGPMVWGLYTGVSLLLLANNAVYFYLRYR